MTTPLPPDAATLDTAAPPAASAPDLGHRLREAAALLEAVAADATLLDGLAPEERARFQRALAAVVQPEPKARRKRLKAEEKARLRAAKAHDDALLDATGIRSGMLGGK